MAFPFPLLHLPYLALDKCIKSNDIEDQFVLSKVSKRSQRVVKCVLRNRKYDAALDFKDDMLTVDLTAFDATKSLNLLALNNITHLELVKNRIAQLTNAFALNEISVEFAWRHYRLVYGVIPFVKQLGVPYDVIVSRKNTINEPNNGILDFILKKCGDANKLDLHIQTSWSFSPNPDHFPPFQCKSVTLRDPKWVTVHHIIEWFMNCSHISLFDCPFNRFEINRFLKAWKKGSKIEHILFSYYFRPHFTLEEVLQGVEATPGRAVSVQQGFMTILGPYNGFIVQQDGGQRAFVHLEDDRRLFMHTKFELEKED